MLFKRFAMNKTFGICVCLQFLSLFVFSQSGVSNLLVENLKNPVGLDVKEPRFSWQLTNERRNIHQQAYEIKVLDGKSVTWNSGRVESKFIRSCALWWIGT
jgi:alpha-L-rhamnosidase